MEFRLTYEGRLLGASRSDTRAEHKHQLRKVFHRQLQRFWQINPYLQRGQPVTFSHGTNSPFIGTAHGSTLIEWIAPRYTRFGYRFIPLVRAELSLRCSLQILFLRPEKPGDLIKSGDIDNRLKTLFDALRMPENIGELGSSSSPGEGEDPFFCLLEDDKLISQVAVETDLLLEPTSDDMGHNDARLVISVAIRPYDFNPSNMSFG
jgi:hypothetical protein